MNPNHKFALLLAVIGCASIVAVKAQNTVLTPAVWHGDPGFGYTCEAKEIKLIEAEKINDIERRLAGVQKQVTLLHSTKEDKDPSKNLITAENFNNLVLCVEGQKRAAAVNGKRIADLEKIVLDVESIKKRNDGMVARERLLVDRVETLEKKVTHIVNILKLQRESVK